MRADTDPRLILCLDALGMSFAMLERLHSQIWPACIRLKTESQQLSSAFLPCWSFVDVVHRLREISQYVPGLSQKHPELKRFLRSTEQAEVLRNYIQHLDRELSSHTPHKFPVWGSLSWVDPTEGDTCHIVHSGTRVGDIVTYGCVFDIQEKRWLSNVSLNAGEAALHFDPVLNSAISFRDFIIPWILNTYKQPLTTITSLEILTIKLRLSDDSKTITSVASTDTSINENAPPE